MAAEVIDLISSSPLPHHSAIAGRTLKRKIESAAVDHALFRDGKAENQHRQHHSNHTGGFLIGQGTTPRAIDYVDLSDDILDAIDQPYNYKRSEVALSKEDVAQNIGARATVDGSGTDAYLLYSTGANIIFPGSGRIKGGPSNWRNAISKPEILEVDCKPNAVDMAIVTKSGTANVANTRRSPRLPQKLFPHEVSVRSGRPETEKYELSDPEESCAVSTVYTSSVQSVHGNDMRLRMPPTDDWCEGETDVQARGLGRVRQTDSVLTNCTSQYPYSPSDSELPEISHVASHMDEVRKQLFSQPVPSTLEANKETAPSKRKGTRLKSRATDGAALRKAQERELKKQAKARDAHAKQVMATIAKVNLLRTDKKVSTPEMIVDLSTDLDAELALQIKHSLDQFQVEQHEFTPNNGLQGVIKWRRKVQAQYKTELSRWEPVASHIASEKHVMCIVMAESLVKRSQAKEEHDQDAHMLKLQTEFKNHKVIFVVQGMATWMRKNRTARNRQFTDAVRDKGVHPVLATSDCSAGVRKRPPRVQAQFVDEELIENSLLELQVVYDALVHHTNTFAETARWVLTFTQHISTIPYRHERMAMDTAFCMETGQVKTGRDSEDTFVRMLQEISRITAPIAYGIAAEYPSVQKLQKAFVNSSRDGRDLLTTVRKSANKDGAFTNREIGKRVSRRLYSILMGGEETCTDV